LLKILIIGAGDVGLPIIQYLSGKEHGITVIELDEAKCKKVSETADAAIFQGSGSDPEAWKTIEAENMNALMALTNDDDVNMGAIKIAKEQYGIPFVIARARQPENVPEMRRLGADAAICPPQETRRLFLNALEGMTTVTLCQYQSADFKSVIVAIPINGSVIGKTLEQLALGDGCSVAAVIRGDKHIQPSGPFVFMGNDRVMILGSIEHVDRVSNRLREIELT
jgi:trk system potassium uptake protein TrkA